METETEVAVLQSSGSEVRLQVTPVWPLVPGERPPSSMVPSILVNAAQGSKLVIGGAGGELIISAVAQVSLGAPGWNVPFLSNTVVLLSWGKEEVGVGWLAPPPRFLPASLPQAIMNKLWLGFDLQAAIAAPILHVNNKGQVEYESTFSQVRPQSQRHLGWTPQCMLLKAPRWISATEYLRPGTLPLWGPSGVEKLSGGGTRSASWPPRQRTGCHPYFSQAEHLGTLVLALSVLFSPSTSFPGCGPSVSLMMICFFSCYLQVYL